MGWVIFFGLVLTHVSAFLGGMLVYRNNVKKLQNVEKVVK